MAKTIDNDNNNPAQSIDVRLSYLGLNDTDKTLLQKLHTPLGKAHSRLIEAFYHHLLSFPETRAFLEDPKLVERLKQKQANYFSELTNGEYGQDYINDRLNVGLAHQRIGLKPFWYIGAYSKYLTELMPEILTACDHDAEQTLHATQALLKIILLDIELALDTYMQADQQAMLHLKDYAEHIICNVPSGLVVLSKDLEIISSNSFLDGLLCDNHAALKGQDFAVLFPNSSLRSHANDVIRSQKPHYGIHQQVDSIQGQPLNLEISICPMSTATNTAENTMMGAAHLLVTIEDLTEQKKLQDATRVADERVRTIMDNVADGIITIDQHGTVESFNSTAEELFGYSATEVLGNNINMLMPEPYHSQHDGYLHRFVATGERKCIGKGFREVEGKRKDGSTFPMDLAISQMQLANQTLFIGMVRNISDRKKAEEQMTKLSSALEQTADAIMITDASGIIEYINAGFEETTGYSQAEMIGKTPKIISSRLMKKEFYEKLWSTLQAGQVFRDIVINKRKDGSLYYEEKTITPLKNNRDEITHYISTGKDITERMQTQEKLKFLAHHDTLTTLPNRLLFLDRMTQAITSAKRNNKNIALMFLDLDRFKTINDTLGHQVGDALLKGLSERLKSTLRGIDTIARLSGDEFALLLQDIHNPDDVLQIANKLLNRIRDPFLIGGHELFVTTSIGIAMYPKDGEDPSTLLKHADIAMYRSKSKSRNTYCFYTPDMNAMAEQHLKLENQLRHALQREEFQLHFQPQYQLKRIGRRSAITGMEALLRWNNPYSGLIYPDEFIKLLEETGLIIPVGEWILHSACKQFKVWQSNKIQLKHISVNISPRQLSDANFLSILEDTLKEYKLKPEQLELEITESMLIQDEQHAIVMLREISDMGIGLAMDDFGTGYSSLSYLKRLPIKTLKIDKSFIHHIPNDQDDCELTRAIIAMGHSLNMQVVAEGVSNAEQLKFLRKLSCDVVQGYYYSPALPADLTYTDFMVA